LLPDLSPFEVEIATADLKKYKLPGTNQIPAEPFQAGGETLLSEIHKFINSIRGKEELPYQWKESLIAPIHKKGSKTDCSNFCEIVLLVSFKILSQRLSP
jgi:hypothetical protein